MTDISFVVGTWGRGGIYEVSKQLAEYFRKKKNFNITLICKNIEKVSDIPDYVYYKKIENTRHFWKEISTIECDILHYHNVYALPGIKNISKPIKTVYTHHGIVPLHLSSNINDINSKFFAYYCALFIRKVNVGVGISNYSINNLRKFHPLMMTTIANPINVNLINTNPEKHTINPKEPKFLYAGLIEKHKGIKDLIIGFKKINATLPKSKLFLVGDGSYLSQAKKLCSNLNINTQVRFFGYQRNESLSKFYKNADIFVDTSLWHSFAIPHIEALGQGLPLLVRDTYATGEHVLKSKAGLTFHTLNEFHNNALKIIDNYANYTTNAQVFIKQYPKNKSFEDYTKLYQYLVKN